MMVGMRGRSRMEVVKGEEAGCQESGSPESYQFRLHRNDGESGVGSRELRNVELLTLTLSFPCNRKRYQDLKTSRKKNKSRFSQFSPSGLFLCIEVSIPLNPPQSPSIPLKAGEEREPSGPTPYSPGRGGIGGLNQGGSKLSYKRHLLSVSILS